MTDTPSRHDPQAPDDRVATPDEHTDLRAEIVIDDGVVELTLYPADATGDELLTRWMTARGDAFVALASMR